jgi:hypothetical protein
LPAAIGKRGCSQSARSCRCSRCASIGQQARPSAAGGPRSWAW